MSTSPPQSDEWSWKVGYAERMDNLLTTGYKSDLTIVVGEKEWKVHKLILQTGSRVLNTQIEKSCSSNLLELKDCSNLAPEIFDMFLKYLYTGDSGVQMKDALRLLQLATEFEVSELRDQCAEILKGDITSDNAIQLFNEAMLFAHKDLIKTTLDFICMNGHEVVLLDSFNDLRLDGLVEVLQQDGLRVKNEIDIFRSVYKWGEAQLTNQELELDTANMKRVLAKPLKYIRFPLMDPKDFGKVVAPKKLLDSDETISLLTSFLLPLDERGDIHGSFSATNRMYLMDRKVVVYRAGSALALVHPGGGSMFTDMLQFCSSRDGMLTAIAISEACFDVYSRGSGTFSTQNSYGLTLTANVKIVQKGATSSCGVDQILSNFHALSMTRSENNESASASTPSYGHFVANLPTPAKFLRDTWISIEVTLQGTVTTYCNSYGGRTLGAEQFQPAYPYQDVYDDEQDPSIKFKFRTGKGRNHGKAQSGLIDHFITVLKC